MTQFGTFPVPAAQNIVVFLDIGKLVPVLGLTSLHFYVYHAALITILISQPRKVSNVVVEHPFRVISIYIRLVLHVVEPDRKHELGLPKNNVGVCRDILFLNVGGIADDDLVDGVLDVAGEADHHNDE